MYHYLMYIWYVFQQRCISAMAALGVYDMDSGFRLAIKTHAVHVKLNDLNNFAVSKRQSSESDCV